MSRSSCFQDPGVPDAEVLTDPAVLGFHVDADAPLIRDLGAEQLMNHAERVAAWAVDSRLNTLTSCTSNDSNCRREFIERFGSRAYRQPLSSAQIDAYEQLMAPEASFE
jgi:hypothetical protein